MLGRQAQFSGERRAATSPRPVCSSNRHQEVLPPQIAAWPCGGREGGVDALWAKETLAFLRQSVRPPEGERWCSVID